MHTTTPIHTFHIPVMGLAYTIDTPVKVARYGINSVVSIIEDKLVELMRKYYCEKYDEQYVPITPKEQDYRAKRITDYLNLLNRIVKKQFEDLRHSTFCVGSELTKYFEMLPGDSILRLSYERLLQAKDKIERDTLVKFLTSQIKPGCIDVNIMTKVDKNNYDRSGHQLTDGSDAVAALRGYANSDLVDSSVIFSAGLNPRLFNYLETLPAFNAKSWATFDKKIVIKVSDYRSAFIQGKYLAKKGIWVSEFRIESGLNCGGHAFATDGSLLGPILEEFKLKREELITSLHALYVAALKTKGLEVFDKPHPLAITVQGGIGTYHEAMFLASRYDVQSTGWGTPFLLCPEATTVDEETLNLLSSALESDIILSKNSPLGIRFNYLKGTSSEREKMARVKKGKPGSPCTEKHLVSNTEFTKDPICTASTVYQQKKIAALKSLSLSSSDYDKQHAEIVSKECLCIGLSNAAIVTYDLPPIKNLKAVTICPGPNIAYFNKVVSLREMTDHIYGRTDITDPARPHMFIKELKLNLDYVRDQILSNDMEDTKWRKEIQTFVAQLSAGIAYYHSLSDHISSATFTEELLMCEGELAVLREAMESKINLSA
ncbi:hypothetical protein DQQ10_00080 [Pseudochryseolinea flava]|uniref:Uncharacterized protein n=2 Tax=Pseudochryseolinea flava TaxID=2059302 RepID=A0A364Y8Q2_9BACT|nr:hypothetical protein DQQ10_00080 [Pseudochryseolinea flava]